MIKFERYPHINDLIFYYIDEFNNKAMKKIMQTGVLTDQDAITFSRFIWEMAGRVNIDESEGNIVLGSSDNSEMLPDVSYEVVNYMKSAGFYATWETISDEEME
jgi:hypothetical protein